MSRKTLHIKLKTEQHEPQQKPAVNSCAPEGIWGTPRGLPPNRADKNIE
jgi:hypothetical protein